MTSALSASIVNQIVTFDTEQKSISVETNDFNLLGTSFTLDIRAFSIFYGNIEVKPFVLTINLSTTGPEFSEAPTADDLSCDTSAEKWEMVLPEIKLND